MRSRYRVKGLRGLEANRLARSRAARASVVPVMDDPFDMTPEVIDVATGKLVTARKRRRK